MHSRSWRIGDDDIGASMLLYELLIENILHITSIEQGVVDIVDLGVDLRVFNGIFHIFNPDDLTSLSRHKISNGSCASVEVIDQFISSECGKLACHLIEVISLLCVGLVERFRSDLELQSLHQFKDMVVSFIDMDYLVGKSIVTLVVVNIKQRCDLREILLQMLHKCHSLSVFIIVLDSELHK